MAEFSHSTTQRWFVDFRIPSQYSYTNPSSIPHCVIYTHIVSSVVHHHSINTPIYPSPPQWLNVLLFFNFLLVNVALPFLVLIRLKNPCRLFLTKWLGLNVFRGPHLTCVAPSAGCAEILGSKSIADSVPAARGEVARFGRNANGKIVGRRGVREVKVLWDGISCEGGIETDEGI